MKKRSRIVIRLLVPVALAVVLIAAAWPAVPSEAAQTTKHIDHHGWQMDIPSNWDTFTSGGPDVPGVVLEAYAPPPGPRRSIETPALTDGPLGDSAILQVYYGPRLFDYDPSRSLNESCYRCAPVVSSSIEPVKIGARWGALRTYNSADGVRHWRLYITSDCFEYWLDAKLAADATPETAAALDRALQSVQLDGSRTFLDHCWQ